MRDKFDLNGQIEVHSEAFSSLLKSAMTFVLTRFAVVGLHNSVDIDIPIKDNTLILIGVNGLGKTTVINFIYYVLTEQWHRLLEYEFDAIEMCINEKELRVSRDDLKWKSRSQRLHQKKLAYFSSRSPYPRSIVAPILSHPLLRDERSFSQWSVDSLVGIISRELSIPAGVVHSTISDLPAHWKDDTVVEPEPEGLRALTEILDAGEAHEVLYLPTYRRIEQDLKSIFPTISDEDLKRLTPLGTASKVTGARCYVELVKFGMEDVEGKLDAELESIQKHTREQLTSLTGSYLQDIIRSRADAVESTIHKNLTDEVVERVLGRVDENTLSNDDKLEVQNAIRRIRSARSAPAARDKYLTYFFYRLLDIFVDLYDREEAIRELARTCNRYFARKKVRYDDKDFVCRVEDDGGAKIEWKSLSSGEKQVASLFTHLHLSKRSAHFVLIDEPELSLSVRWQKIFLPDIADSDSCKLLIAVTHSPFIYANKLDKYAVDLSKLIRKHI